MARSTVTYIFCDFCLGENDVQTEAQELPPITLGNAKPRLLALCKQHREDWYEPFVEAVKEYGVMIDGSSPARSVITPTDPKGTLELAPDGEKVLCPVCKAAGVIKPLKNRNTVMTHMRSDHQTTLSQWEREHGPANTPENGQGELPGVGEAPKAPEPHSLSSTREPPEEDKRQECPECKAQDIEVVYQWPENARPVQALAVHRSRAHGVPGQGKRGKRRRETVNA